MKRLELARVSQLLRLRLLGEVMALVVRDQRGFAQLLRQNELLTILEGPFLLPLLGRNQETIRQFALFYQLVHAGRRS